VNERNLSRRLSTSVVDALKAHGHILVVKGGAAALARELDELIGPDLALVEQRMEPRGILAGEPTTTFGDDTVDQIVEELVARLTRALMRSDHVEDVFAEDNVIRRDIFRVVRDGLLQAPPDTAAEDYSSITVKLDLLGYVAATVSKRADPATLRQALDRAAAAAEARFSGYVPELREATFRAEDGGSDERLELEEAVADELTDLVEQGVVDLPTVERRLDLGRSLRASEQRALRGRIDGAAETTLLPSGVHATWDFADARTLRITFTPLSDQDALGVDAPTAAFARELAALLASTGRARAPEPIAEPPAPPRAAPPPAAPTKDAAPEAREPEPAPAKRAAAKKTTKAKAAEPAEKPVKKTGKKTAKKAAEPSAPAAKPAKKAATKTAPKAAKAAKAPAKKR
jgi:hypothetical protein